MRADLIQALIVGLIAYGVSLVFRGGLSGRLEFDAIHAVIMICSVAGVVFWSLRKFKPAR